MEPDQMCAIGGCPGEATGPVVFRDGTQQFVCSEHHHEIQRVIGFAVQVEFEMAVRQQESTPAESVDDASSIFLDLDGPPPLSAKDTKVYFARRRLDGLVKIGYSTDVSDRLRHIAIGGGPLDLVYSEPGGLSRERELHEMFASDRVHGEWFTESDAMKEYLCASQSSPLD
jgi:hypothetical protein